MLTHELEDPGHASGIAGRARKSCSVTSLAAEQTSNRHLAAVRSMESLQDECHCLVAGFDTQTPRRFANARGFMPQCLHQSQHTVAAGSDTDQNRTDDTVAQFLGETVEHLVAWRLDI